MESRRLASIDVFRAITMLLMVFVNDLWTLSGVPSWLEHAPAQADAMGFSDVIFPSFLFIVGLSIPFALNSRLARGESKGKISAHIFFRSLALIVMGFFQVNLENYSEAAVLPRGVWEIVITFSFFLIWLDYRGEKIKKVKPWLQVTGIVLLIIMAVLYRGNQDQQTVWMRTQWWGILGLIGWAYLLCAAVFLFCRKKAGLFLAWLLVFIAFNAASATGWLDLLSPVTRLGLLDLGNASNSTLIMAGIVAGVVYKDQALSLRKAVAILAILAGWLILFGLATRPVWGISKIRATPSWTTLCGGICLLFFILLIYLVDRKGKQAWFRLIRPAGTSTLTCYLLPYFHIAVFISLLDWRLPMALRTGGIGIVKSMLFALAIVWVTGLLEKRKLRLKI